MSINNEFDSEQDAIRALETEGRRLLDIAVKIWRQYLASYRPKTYVRHGDSEKSIKLGVVKKLNDDTLGIELTFEDDLAYHDSVVSKSGLPTGHSIMLISEGWHTNGKFQTVYRFGYYEGFHYLSKVEEAWNNGNNKGVSLEIQWAGKPFERGKKQENVLR